MKKENLQYALEVVKPGLANKEVVEQSTSFAFIDGKVVTYNDEISISHPVEGLDITGAIQAEELYQILKKIDKEEIEISVVDNEIRLTAGKSRAGLILHQEVKLPLEEIGAIGKWKALPDNFLKGLQFAVPSCSRDNSRPKLTCVHCSDNNYIEASDGHRISRLTLSDPLPVASFLLPADSTLKVLRLMPTKIAEGKGWIHFKTEEGTILSCRVFEEKYLELDPHVKVEGNWVTLPETIYDIVDRANIFAKRDSVFDEEITITIEKQKLTVRSESDAGWFEEKTKIESTDSLKFKITPILFKSIIKETQSFICSNKALRFDGEDWFYVMALKA